MIKQARRCRMCKHPIQKKPMGNGKLPHCVHRQCPWCDECVRRRRLETKAPSSASEQG
jgi:hypothetical protein